MECLRAMSSVCTGPTSVAIGRSDVRCGAGASANICGRVGGVAALSVPRVPVQWAGFRALTVRRSVVRATGRGATPDEPLDYKVDKAATEAGRKFDETKQSIGISAEDLQEKARREVDESKQSLSSTMEDLKRKATETKSVAEDTATKELEKLKDITNQLMEQAEAARQKLAATAQETAFKQKDNLVYVAENGPDPVKEVAESALNAHYSESGKTGSKIHDFCLGIPYGIFLAAGGLLWFIISGATSAIRFGVLLGSALLYLSVTSLKKWKKGESSMAYIQGQTAITAFIFLRYYKRYSVNKVFFPTGVTGLISGAMLAFYIYVLVSGGNPPKKPKTQSD